MKNEAYAIIRQENVDRFQTMFKTKEEAKKKIKWEWEKYLTKEEKRKIKYYAVVKGEPDENGYIDFENVTKIIMNSKNGKTKKIKKQAKNK